ncbi:bifunctional protein pyrR [Elysia marginata]|uniref:Bifunctional protein pyrR n=1 Tax=Elysia marginata TaxID=1093978 RepID=A0AAV4JVV0_9GAST|nr:bifunctional protein pyrR [Elysia marginata]
MIKKTILTPKQFNITLHRLVCQILENHLELSELALVGLQPRGIYLAERIASMMRENYKVDNFSLGHLDITFFRDDFRRNENPLQANQTKIDFVVEGKQLVIIDDVLYTGRSVNSALAAIQAFGRPRQIELLTLIDRRFSRHLPIQPNYRGRQVDAFLNESVLVKWKENDGEDGVYVIDKTIK